MTVLRQICERVMVQGLYKSQLPIGKDNARDLAISVCLDQAYHVQCRLNRLVSQSAMLTATDNWL